jgi:hypothetical protein
MNISSMLTRIKMKKFKTASAAIVVAMLGGGAAQAHIIEDIYTGDVNFSSTTFTAIFEYNDQIGNDAPTEVKNSGFEDPTLYAKVTFSDGTSYTLPAGGPGASSDYYVIPGFAIASDFVDNAGDFFQIGAMSSLTPSGLDVAFTDNGASTFTGTAQVGGQFFDLPASTVQVIVDPSPVPEPSTWALMIVGVAGMSMALRLRPRPKMA